MNESPNRRGVFVGFFVLLGILFFIGGILMIGNLHETFKNKMEVVSFFDDVNGLQKGNNVWFSGVKIGTVSSLQFYGKSQVEVRIKIETKTQQYIRRDAMVKISSDGIIGNKILIIYGGTSAAPEIQAGDTLGVEKTFSTEDMINTLQENNKNILAITTDFKEISKTMAAGEGTIGKLMKDDAIYANINAATASLKLASVKADQLVGSLNTFSSNLNKKGTLANELTTDTTVFKSVKASVMQLQQMADTASAFIANLKQAGTNPNSPVGIMLRDEASGARIKETIKNLESSSQKLDEDLKAAQSSFLLKGYFRKKVKTESDASETPVK
jgi:phospholipid/cholesterol/gamma-HCH transport system substrate-binding protein